jgi:hypothetical protein
VWLIAVKAIALGVLLLIVAYRMRSSARLTEAQSPRGARAA